MIGAALRDKWRARGALGFVGDAVESVAYAGCAIVVLGVTSVATVLAVVVLAPLVLFSGDAERCDGGCGSRSMDDCRHGGGR